MTSTDVLVAGAGLGGTAASLFLARRGLRVILAGPEGSPDRGLSGEWLHPAGVAGLQRLGLDLSGADFITNHGFMVHPGTGDEPVMLPYAHGTAVTMRHHTLVHRLRQEAAATAEITPLLGDRVTKTDLDGSAVTTTGRIRARLVVGADGRASLIRRALRPAEPPAPVLSATAGFELTGATLPVEGYGHVFLGGPGPTLAYRITPDTVRLLLDVPPRRLPPSEMLDYLAHGYAPALPAGLHDAFLSSLSSERGVRWATNRFRPRTYYGVGRRALVGDAVGFNHPLAALGMTSAILDAECLARHATVTDYARERRARSWASERLSIALHRSLTDTDTPSGLLRDSLIHLWRYRDADRDRMMRLLAVQEDGHTEFGVTVARITATALYSVVRSTECSSAGDVFRRVRTVLGLANWLIWLYGSDPYIRLRKR